MSRSPDLKEQVPPRLSEGPGNSSQECEDPFTDDTFPLTSNLSADTTLPPASDPFTDTAFPLHPDNPTVFPANTEGVEGGAPKDEVRSGKSKKGRVKNFFQKFKTIGKDEQDKGGNEEGLLRKTGSVPRT